MALKTCGVCNGSGNGIAKTDARGNRIGFHSCTNCGGSRTVHVQDSKSGNGKGCLLVFVLLGLTAISAAELTL